VRIHHAHNKTQNTMKQTKKISQSGSFINYLMSNNNSIPVVNDWATELMWSDRRVYLIREISKDMKRVVVESCHTYGNGSKEMGHQDWKHEPNGHLTTWVYRYGAWYVEYLTAEFTNEFKEMCDENGFRYYYEALNDEQYNQVYGNELTPQNVVDGITKLKKEYSKISIMFGVCDYHYDWTF